MTTQQICTLAHLGHKLRRPCKHQGTLTLCIFEVRVCQGLSEFALSSTQRARSEWLEPEKASCIGSDSATISRFVSDDMIGSGLVFCQVPTYELDSASTHLHWSIFPVSLSSASSVACRPCLGGATSSDGLQPSVGHLTQDVAILIWKVVGAYKLHLLSITEAVAPFTTTTFGMPGRHFHPKHTLGITREIVSFWVSESWARSLLSENLFLGNRLGSPKSNRNGEIKGRWLTSSLDQSLQPGSINSRCGSSQPENPGISRLLHLQKLLDL